jgi:2-dehydropantoate 2-reductase
VRTLIVGAGALGGLVAARLRATGAPVSIATRDEASAARLRSSGLRVTGVGGAVSADAPDVAPLEVYRGGAPFDLVVLATKAPEAMAVARDAAALVAPGGTLLPIQNGAVPELLAARLGTDRVLGGLSNLGATMHGPGVYEQRNAGHLLVGELDGRRGERAERVRGWLGRAVEVRVTAELRGAIWSKLLLNCAGTTLGAVAGGTIRQLVAVRGGRAAFERAYAEALAVGLASGARPVRMLVEPIPPGGSREAYDAWLGGVVAAYGDLKPSMLQDLERGRTTEIDFINGYVVELGRRLGVSVPVNEAIVGVVHAMERGEMAPGAGAVGRVVGVAR